MRDTCCPQPVQLLDDDDQTHLRETVPVQRVRPLCPDDSVSVPLSRRMPGEAVDCWALNGWWEVRARGRWAAKQA